MAEEVMETEVKEIENILKEIGEDENKKKAVLTYQNDGKYLIIAGPGTGKTYTVSKRIKAILSDNEKGTTADRILCLTFSDAAAREMRLGLEEEHVSDAEGVNIFTFHSFCMNLMEQYPDVFKIENKSLITPIQKQAIVKKCIDELDGTDKEIKYMRTEDSPYANIDDIVKGIEAIKHNRLTPEKIRENINGNIIWKSLLKDYDNKIEDLENNPIDRANYKDDKKYEDAVKKQNDDIEKLKEKKIAHQNNIDKIEQDLLNIYEIYKEKTKYFIDYDDMINLVLEEFEKNPKFLQDVADQYDFVMVDEYQDTNKSQNDIVFALANHCKNIFVVGDDDQIIYTFQGASLDTIKNFEKELNVPEENVISLEQNRRSTETILKVAEKLAEFQDEYPLRFAELKKYSKAKTDEFIKKPFPFRYKPKKLISFKKELKIKDKPVIINKFSDNSQECTYIVNKIKQIVEGKDENPCPVDKNGEKLLSEIAVLTKTNNEAYTYANRLKELGIKVQLAGGKDIFEINSIKVLIAYMQFMANPEENKCELYKYLLYRPFHIHPHDYKILHSPEMKEYSNLIRRMEEAVKISDNEEAKSERQDKNKILKDKNKLVEFVNTYHELENYITCESVKNAIIQIVHKTGIYKCYLAIEINRRENMAAIERLLNEADSFETSKRGMTVLEDTGIGELSNFKGFVSYLNTLITGGIRVFTDKTEKPYNSVQVCTIHSSKGREFEYVFMPSLNCKKFESNSKDEYTEIVPKENTELTTPDDNLINNIDKLEDKKRQVKFVNSTKLIYVGMTRAKHYLALSYQTSANQNPASWFIRKILKWEEDREKINPNAKKYITNEQDQIEKVVNNETRDKNYDKEINNAIEKIKELKEHLHIDKEYEEEFNANLETIEKIKKVLEVSVAPDEATKLDYDYASEFNDYIIDNIPQKHSVSSLKAYFDCPKKYLYQRILHLIPEENTDEDEERIKETYFTQWGIIIHYALENYVREILDLKDNRKMLPFEEMEKYFNEKQEEILGNASESTILARKENLKKFLDVFLKPTDTDDFPKISPDNLHDVEKAVDVKISEDEVNDNKNEKQKKTDEFHFTGKVDRIDKVGQDDKGNTEYIIYDYKTGKNKDKVKDDVKIDGGKEYIYNQLAFYKYVLQEKYKMKIRDVGIIFPEEPKSSFLVKELNGEEGFKKCKEVIKKYIEALKNLKEIEKTKDVEIQKLFECEPTCKKGGEYCFCDYQDFCSSNVL